jgi:hypothetical protein
MAAFVLAAGCGTGTVEYSHSARMPVVTYYQSQALPPPDAPQGPVLIVYGDGTAYQRHEQMDYITGTLTKSQVEGLLTSMIDKGFFEMAPLQGKDLPGGITDHITVSVKGRSKGVEGPDTSGGDFGAVLKIVKEFQIPSAREYLPDQLSLFAKQYSSAEPFKGTVLDWTADPALLEQAAAPVAGISPGAHASGPQAQQVWKLLASSQGGDEEIAWRAGGKLYVQVYAVPAFPAPGI